MISVIFVVTVRHVANIPLNNHWSVRIRQPSFVKTIFGSTCRMTFTSKNGATNTVDFNQDYFNCPVFVLPSAESNALFCVYDYDVDWQLIKFTFNEPFTSIAADSPLWGMVTHCDCKVERITRGEVSNWNWVADAVGKMSSHEFRNQSLSLGFFGFHPNRQELVMALRDFGKQGQYPGDVVVPAYIAQYQKTNGLDRKPRPSRSQQ
jgi:hypothetical protein